MRALLAKDVQLIAPYWWVIAPAHLLWCVQALLDPELYFWFSLAASLAWTVSIVFIEWQLDAERLVASLPVSRGEIVRARYLSALAGLGLGAVLFVVYAQTVASVVPDPGVILPRRGTPAWAAVDGVLAFLAAGYTLLITFLPFHFGLGFARAAALFPVSAAIAVTVVMTIVRLAVSGERLAEATPVAARLSSSELLRGLLSWPAVSWGPWPAAVVLFAMAALVGFVSVQLSARAYRAREL